MIGYIEGSMIWQDSELVKLDWFDTVQEIIKCPVDRLGLNATEEFERKTQSIVCRTNCSDLKWCHDFRIGQSSAQNESFIQPNTEVCNLEWKKGTHVRDAEE